MNSKRTVRLVVVCGLLGAAGIAAGLSSPASARERVLLVCPDPSVSVTIDVESGSAPFDAQEWEGLACQMTSLNANVSYNSASWGQPGAVRSRNLAISGALMDPMGGRVYRILGMPRVLELTDLAGRDLLSVGQVHVHPQPPYSMQFTRPNGGMTNVAFGVNIAGGDRSPRGIGRMRIEVDAQLAGDMASIGLAHERQEEMVSLAENLSGRVTSFSVDDRGVFSMGFEYRIEMGDGARPAFYSLEFFDAQGKLINSVNQAREIVTRDAVIGSLQIPDMSIGQRELGEVRLTLVTDLLEHTFVIEADNLPLMD